MKSFKEKIIYFTKKVKGEITLYRSVMNDERTPLTAKILLWIAIGYLLLPFDLIPDFIPVLGQLDDLVIVPALVYSAVLIIPAEIIQEHRNRLET